MLDRDRRPTRGTLLHGRRLTQQFGNVGRAASKSVDIVACCAARRTRSTALSMSKGLGRYSKAPP